MLNSRILIYFAAVLHETELPAAECTRNTGQVEDLLEDKMVSSNITFHTLHVQVKNKYFPRNEKALSMDDIQVSYKVVHDFGLICSWPAIFVIMLYL